MPAGVALSILAYGMYSWCDAMVKALGSNLGVYEIAFFGALFSFFPAIFTKPKGESWRRMWQMRHPWLLNFRSLAGVIGNICVITAYVSVPLAEVYSINFLAPIFIVILSVLFLKEKVSLHRWLFLAASFGGVLLVVRPGFRELELGHITALCAAVLGAISTTIIRKVAPVEKRVSLIGLPLGYIVLFNGIMMIPTFTMPTLFDWALFIAIGAIGGTANIIFIAATRLSPASEIAPAQYTQIVWAILLGALAFHEYPDAIAYVGLAVVVTFGILNVISDETRIRIISRLSPGIGPATAISEVSPPLDDNAGKPPQAHAKDAL